ncbi:Uncharacterised protein [Escherichia coli]|uniref:Secreted protein n=1 Tax=Escherichia coli TaxID=562 RepID=A0A376X170_ECOLX|nr:Uncharacterised protein [Escherichia coli]
MSCSGLVTKCICLLAGCGVNALSGLQVLAKSINCDCPHRPDKLAHRATYTCHVSFQLTHRQQLVGTACVIIDAADHLHLHFKKPRAGNHVAHCRNGMTLLPSRTPDITRKVGSACSTGPRVAWVSALKRKMPSSPRCTSLPVASPV